MYFLLVVGFSLIIVNIQGTQIITCEAERMEIICQGNNVIQINEANYGRTSPHYCNRSNKNINDLSCYADAALRILKIKCDDIQGCVVNVISDVFGDPCYGIYKYLEIDYECVPDPGFQYETTCENAELNIKCKKDEIIKIIEANYGRMTQSICNVEPIRTTHCFKKSTNIVADLCNNLTKCTVKAGNEIFGDPCFGTVKYLTVKYKCIKASLGIIQGEKIITCENDQMEIICSGNNVINIKSADYGRTSKTLCTKHSIQNIDCRSQDTLAILYLRCHKKQTCLIAVNGDVFGDPCYGTLKYLEVDYECIPDPDGFQYGSVCAHDNLTISCKLNETIKIAEANYGRTTKSICRQGPVKTVYCLNKESTETACQKCDGQQTCTLPARNELFGDPCYGTFKYLTVKYKCLEDFKCSNDYNIPSNKRCDNNCDCPVFCEDEASCKKD